MWGSLQILPLWDVSWQQKVFDPFLKEKKKVEFFRPVEHFIKKIHKTSLCYQPLEAVRK